MTWPVATLEDLAAKEPRAITDGPFGSNLASRHYTEVGPRVVRLQNIGDGRFIDAQAHISQEHFESLRAHEVRGGDLLVASLGEVLPRACLAPVWLGPAIVKADCIRVRLSDRVEPRWVLYALQRPEARRWADEHRHGVGRPRLGLKMMRRIPIPLPPLDEQRRIVDILEDHLSRLDAANAYLAAAERRARLLWTARLSDLILPPNAQDLLQRDPAILGGESPPAADLPAGWRWMRWEEVGSSENGKPFPSRDYQAAGIRLLRPGNLGPNGALTWGDASTRFMSLSYLDSHEKSVLHPGDLVMNLTAQSLKDDFLGRVCLVRSGDESLLNQRIARLRPTTIDVGFALAVFRSRLFRHYVKSLSTGSLIQHMFTSQVNRFWIPVPPAREQQAVAQAAQGLESDVARQAQVLRDQSHRLPQLRRTLLASAFTGRLMGADGGQPVAEEVDA